MELGGQEHDIYEPDNDPLIYKLTKRSSFGLHPHYDPDAGTIHARPALPSEYLQRLLLQNELFGDDIALEGLAITSGGSVHTLTSQGYIAGEAASADEIDDLMNEHGFEVVDRVLGAWIHPKRHIAVLDAVPRNVVRDPEGRVLPIDLILGYTATKEP